MGRIVTPTGEGDRAEDIRLRSADQTDRFADDQFLRKHGFRIVSRPDIWTAIWGRHGREYTFYGATQVARWEEGNP